MYRKSFFVVATGFVLLSLLLMGGSRSVAQGPAPQAPLAPLGTGFTYQGQLKKSNSAITGNCSMAFRLYDQTSGGSQVGSPITTSVPITNGLFTVMLNDSGQFGSTAFTGERRWLGILVQCPGDSAYADLGRQELTAAPQSLYSLSTGALQGRPVANTAPTTGQVLKYDGSQWSPAVGNQPPAAILQTDPSVLYLGLEPTGTAVLNMAPSYDPEGSALTYAFDPLGQTPDLPTSYGSVPTYTAVYTSEGNYLAAGWARDAGGAYARTQAQVAVYRFEGAVADRNGYRPSMAVVANRPAMAYFADSRLKFVRADNATGLSWGITHTVDSVGPSFASLAEVQGYPAIAYYDSVGGNLKYTRADNQDGNSWIIISILDSASGSGQNVSLAVVNGNPAIAYWDFTSKILRYIRADNSIGTSWGVTVTVANLADGRLSMSVVNGYPAIAFCTASGLMYTQSSDVNGSAWPGLPVTVDSSGCGALSLTMVNGRPAIAYARSGPRYVRANDADGSSWPTSQIVLDSGAVNAVSMAVVRGHPAIAYLVYPAGPGPLKYSQANDAIGTTWGAPLALRGPGDNNSLSLVEVEGRPGVAYQNTEGSLLFTIPRQ